MFAINKFSLVAIMLLLPVLMGIPPSQAADDGHHPHHLAILGGVAEQNSEQSGYIGLDYSYRISDKWALGGFYEEVSGDFDLQVWGLFGMRYFESGWKIGAGPGIERKIKKDKLLGLLRLTGGYDWHFGKWSIGPVATYDLIETGENTSYLGLSFGFGF